MNRSVSEFLSQHWLSAASICLLTLSGFGFLYAVLVGESHGLKAWLLPFGPWCVALIVIVSMRRRHRK
jgi:hypothetical protein